MNALKALFRALENACVIIELATVEIADSVEVDQDKVDRFNKVKQQLRGNTTKP